LITRAFTRGLDLTMSRVLPWSGLISTSVTDQTESFTSPGPATAPLRRAAPVFAAMHLVRR
jgi:hypothetical protein